MHTYAYNMLVFLLFVFHIDVFLITVFEQSDLAAVYWSLYWSLETFRAFVHPCFLH